MGDLLCPACGAEATTGPTYPPRCACGSLWSARDPEGYLEGIPAAAPTPVWSDPGDAALWWKREDLTRTGSFKDRGAEVLVRAALRGGATALVLDSSGSAALAGASAAAVAGLPLTVHVPGSLPAAKLGALEIFGATVVARGTRGDAASRALEEATGAFYLSHVHHPAFIAGTSRVGSEVLSQLGDAVPPLWVVPVGNGSLFLGLDRALTREGIEGVRLIAVQASASPGLRRPGTGGATLASGIGIADPPRREEILTALHRWGGRVIEVDEDELAAARASLWHHGVAAEYAAAAAAAAMIRLRRDGESGGALAFLTGSGHRGGG
jgi:threonine synthase